MRNDKKIHFLLKSYLFYMKYKQNSQFDGHFGRHLEFQYEESTSRLGTQAKKFAHCIIVNIQPSNLFSGGGGTKLFFCPIGFCTIMQNTAFFCGCKNDNLEKKNLMILIILPKT